MFIYTLKILVVMNKTVVVYESKNPFQEGVTHIAIQTETQPPYVWATYFCPRGDSLPRLGDDMLVISADQARHLFDFKQGNLDELVR